MSKFYLRLLTKDSKLKLEEVNEETFSLRKSAIADDGSPRFINDEYVKIEGNQLELTLKNIPCSDVGWIARLMNITTPTGTNPDFIRPLGPVKFKRGKTTILITPTGEVFKRA